jgi:succinyl-CoA synthetase alpha subunit
VIFVPARFAGDAILEAVDAGVGLIVCITEGIPGKEMLAVRYVVERQGAILLGPNTPGLLSPPDTRMGHAGAIAEGCACPAGRCPV